MKGAHTLGLLHCPHSSYVIALPMPTLAGVGGKKVWFLNAYGSPSNGEASWGLRELLWWWYLARAKKSNEIEGGIILSPLKGGPTSPSVQPSLGEDVCLLFFEETSPWAWQGMLAGLLPNTPRLLPKSCWQARYQNLPLSSQPLQGLCLHHVVASRAQLLGPVSA